MKKQLALLCMITTCIASKVYSMEQEEILAKLDATLTLEKPADETEDTFSILEVLRGQTEKSSLGLQCTYIGKNDYATALLDVLKNVTVNLKTGHLNFYHAVHRLHENRKHFKQLFTIVVDKKDKKNKPVEPKTEPTSGPAFLGWLIPTFKYGSAIALGACALKTYQYLYARYF